MRQKEDAHLVAIPEHVAADAGAETNTAAVRLRQSPAHAAENRPEEIHGAATRDLTAAPRQHVCETVSVRRIADIAAGDHRKVTSLHHS